MSNSILDKIALLNNITLGSLSETDKITIIKSFTEAGMKILEADFGFVWYRPRSNNKYRLIYTSLNLRYSPHYPRRKGTNYVVQHNKEPLMVSNVKKAPFVSIDTRTYMKSLIVIPIAYQNNTYGNIVLGYNKIRKFSENDRSLSIALGNAAAQALTISRLHLYIEEQYQKMLKQKDEFLGVASHELRTPITTIKGFAQLLQQKSAGGDPQLNYFASKINTQVDKLARFVEELLDVSKIEAGKLPFRRKKIKLHELLKEIVEDLQFSTTQHEIILNGEIYGFVVGDPDRLSQVFMNILTNAIKYSPSGGQIIIRFRQKGPTALVSVQDFGIGIPKRHQRQIFNRFFQGRHSKASAFPGLGLGLYISREIVRRHGGEIWFESEKDKGTTFYVELPREKMKK